MLSIPFIIYQTIMFIIPGLTYKEAKLFLPILIASIILFFTGIYFGFFILIPAALQFLIHYGADIVEPIWSFEQYFDFILILLVSTGLAFQIPIIQILAGILGVVSSEQMAQSWKHVLLLSTIISAILTPSTDPATQLILSAAILTLYFAGILILKLLSK
jgi:sec-independent protein translocase protein TatC